MRRCSSPCCSLRRALHAWKPATQQAIALDAAQLAPPDLARLIAKHRKEYLRGAVEPLTDGNAFRHMKNSDGSGELDRVIAAEIAAAIDLIRRHRPFAEVVARLGRLSHFVADANLPLNTANTDPGEGRYFRDFLDYADSARPRFAVVFYGLGPAWQSPRDVQAWTRDDPRAGPRALSRDRRGVPSDRRRRRATSAASMTARPLSPSLRSPTAMPFRMSRAPCVTSGWRPAGRDPREQLAEMRSDLILLDAGAGR